MDITYSQNFKWMMGMTLSIDRPEQLLGWANRLSAHSIIRATLINVKSSYGIMLMVNCIKLLMVLAFYHCDCRYSNSTDDQRAYSYRTI